MPNTLPTLGRFLHLCAPTPLVPVQLEPGAPSIWCKLEFLNPSGSTKDRIARFMLEKAWRQGRLQPGGEVVEASSGSTSLSLALACAQLGLRFTAVVPEGVSTERLASLRAYGAAVKMSPKSEGIRGALLLASRHAEETGAHYTRQFENPDNPDTHRRWTGQEVLAQVPNGMVHAVVSGVGTGGTIVGLYQAFAEAGCPTVPFSARPTASRALSDVECCSFSTRVPGVVEGISSLYTREALPGLVELDVDDDLALGTTRRLIRAGFPVGPSSGLNFAAACEAARRLPAGSQVVTVFPDRMERYFSTELFAAPAAQ
jgi:cysteine synthase A